MKRNVLLLIYIAAISHTVSAQWFSFEHDESVMQQFLFGETGTGFLTPSAYYQGVHSSYQKDMVTNKQTLRSKFYASMLKESPFAENIDSVMQERAKAEAWNIADRIGGAADVAWMAEGEKIESKFRDIMDAIGKIVPSGGSVSDKNMYSEKLACLMAASDEIRDAYLPNSFRKREYLAIYDDAVLLLEDINRSLICASALKKQKEMSKGSSLHKQDIASIAEKSRGRFIKSFKNAVLFGNVKSLDKNFDRHK